MKIDMTEVQDQKTALSTSQTSLSNQIETAKSSFVNLVNSESLKGDVKSAINAKISNHQIPLLTNFSNAMSVLSAQYDKTIEQFQTTVSETAADAIIDTDYLQGILDNFSSIETSIATVDGQTASIYNSISDIISLTNPDASAITTPLSEGKTILTDTKTNMESFNGWERGDEYSELLLVQASVLRGLETAGESSFTSEEAKAFYNDTAFMDGVVEVANAVSNSTPVKLLDAVSKILNKISSGEFTDELINKSDKKIKEKATNPFFIARQIAKQVKKTGIKRKGEAWLKLTKDGLDRWGGRMQRNILRKINKATRLKLNANKALGTLSDLRSNKGVKVALKDVKESFKNLKTPKGVVKSIGIIGTVEALWEGKKTYDDSLKKYGQATAIRDAAAHTASSVAGQVVGAQVGAIIGSAIPIPVVGTLAGAAIGGFVGGAVSNGINHVWDKFSHGEWKLPKLW
ncbi:T7SS effector LXG polymorphic toxin [Streptococcus oralis]|uniref:LXG domain-containing protein n=1 Tax=Streptococcus oralis subsp. oralis TaxID=1891914 RepID=A0ABD6RJV9_STROR|nr:T7SS effector LXG polymorphic toxin [Streptococcus oralis]MBA1350756.1 hypothetical protein [Streptococcus oralis subsp. oralis]ORO74247.1 hypothetical protein B7711_02365 [Streptococcus oralis subsp. oralis]